MNIPVYIENIRNRIGFLDIDANLLNKDVIRMILINGGGLKNYGDGEYVEPKTISWELKPHKRTSNNFEVYHCYYPVFLTLDQTQFKNKKEFEKVGYFIKTKEIKPEGEK